MAYHHSELSLFHISHLFFTAAHLKIKSTTVTALSCYLSIQQPFETCHSIGTGHDSQTTCTYPRCHCLFFPSHVAHLKMSHVS